MNQNILQKNYTLNSGCYQLKIPVELDAVIPENDCVRLLSQYVEELDLTVLYDTYARHRRNTVTPKQLLKIVLYAYHEGAYSSRDIEKACNRDINFMYLLEGMPAPDHTTISRFISLHFSECAENLMASSSNFLKEIGELSGKEIFIDGTKIEAMAGRYTFVWKKSVTKNLEKLLVKTALLVETCVKEYALKEIPEGKVEEKHIVQILTSLTELKDAQGIEFVYGSGKCKTQLQRDIEALESYRDRIIEYNNHIDICGERNSYSKTDPDATFMRMKEDHMLNGQLKPAYNLQHGVDSGYISWLTVNQNPGDTVTLRNFISNMHGNLNFSYKVIVADAGYESEENYTFLENNNLTAVIKPTNYEQSKTRKYQGDISLAENMKYNPDGDYYICENGNRLVANNIKNRRTQTGYVRKITEYKCFECTGCPYKDSCIKGRNWKVPKDKRFKKIEVSRKFVRQRKECMDRITSEEGTMLRMNRSIQAEGSFAELKEDRKFRRYKSRGIKNVYAESVLMAISHNIGKLHRKIQGDKTGTHLYELKAA